jgi:hypothetical protein
VSSGMNDLSIALLVFAIIFGGALVGMAVRPLLSEEHLHPDSRARASGLSATASSVYATGVSLTKNEAEHGAGWAGTS